MTNRVNQPKYTIKNTLVKGQGISYNLNNKHDAQQLCHTLNQYETQLNHQINYEKLKQQIIILQMGITQIQADLDKIKELLK